MPNANAKSTPMTPAARSRIARATTKTHGGKIPAGSFASRADATVQRQAATGGTSQVKKN